MLKQTKSKLATLTTTKAVILAVVGLFVVSVMVPALAQADNFENKIKQLEQQRAADQAQSNVLREQANSYQAAVAQLQTQINELQAQINANTAKSNDLQRQITEAEAELARQRKTMGESIKRMYLEGQISTMEMFFSSKDLSEFVDKQQYRNSVQNQIKETLDKINLLKAQLRQQKETVEQLLKEQQAMQAQVAADRNKQSEMLAYTQAQKAEYDAQIKATNAEISKQRAAQAAYYASISGGGSRNYGASGSFAYRNYSHQGYCGGGYRFCAWGLDQWVSAAAGDTWGLHYARECVHYAADIAARGRNLNGYFGNGRGNATNWPSSLSNAPGVVINNTPAPGAVAIKFKDTARGDYYGHAMVVTYVLDDGWVGVSQMNWGPPGSYSTMEIKASGVVFIHFN